jgi:uncharacterized protein YndB with AHSA1/START domain
MILTESLEVERLIPATIERVFDAWLDADSVKKWMRPGPGMTVPRVNIDARVGGKYLIVMASPEREIPHEGEYRVIDRPNRLVFTWVSEPAGDSLVTVLFEQASGESTRVVLKHEKLPNEQSRDGHRNGWGAILEALERSLAAPA